MMPNVRNLAAIVLVGLTPVLAGCLARTAASVVTAPVRVVSQGVDWATTSQSEADEKRGRRLRKQEERYGKLERDYRRRSEQCDRHDEEACRKAREAYEEMQDLQRE